MSIMLFLIEKIFILNVIKSHFNPIALRKDKIVCNFGLSECNRVKGSYDKQNLTLMVISYEMTTSVRSSISPFIVDYNPDKKGEYYLFYQWTCPFLSFGSVHL